MYRRTARLAAALLAGVLGLVLLPLLGATAPAGAADPEPFQLDLVEGELVLRGAEEPHVLENPTRLTGTNTDGALSGVAFQTPTVHIVQEVEVPPTTAEIDASFTMNAPATGTLNSAGELAVQLSLTVDLVINTPILPETQYCTATPVNITLSTTEAYDEDSDEITVSAPNFSMPPVAASDECLNLLAERVNEQLAGPGHALTMTLEGELTPPTIGEPTETTLAVAPAGESDFGDDVTLTATVVPDPPVPGAPPITGQVAFFDGSRSLGTVDVDAGGVAELVVSDLAAGSRSLRARYLGMPPSWDPSDAAAVAHTVIAAPAITSDLTGLVVTGGPPREFGVTVVNTGFGAQLDDAELRVTVQRAPGYFGPIGPDGGTPRIVLRRDVGGVPADIALTPSGETLQGVVGDTDTWDLAPGEEHSESLEIAVSSALDPGPLLLVFEILPSGGGTALASGSAEVTAVDTDRIPSEITAGEPGDPPFFPTYPEVTPGVARQGNNVELYDLRIEPGYYSFRPSGTYEFYIAGKRALARITGLSGNGAYVPVAPVVDGFNYSLRIPDDVAPGEHEIIVKYSGDTNYLPSQVAFPVTVLPSIGVRYECIAQTIGGNGFTANVVAQATIPPVAATGRDIDLTRVSVQLAFSRTVTSDNVLGAVDANDEDADLSLTLAADGTVEFDAIDVQNSTPRFEDDGLGPDQIATLSQGTGSIPLDAAPGEAVPITLDTITTTYTDGSGFANGIICNPVGDPILLGTVTAAGTTLQVDPGTVAGSADDITLTATALPARPGVIEFRDGTTTIGVVPVDTAGVAMMSTTLPAGERSLTARFFGGSVGTSPSEPVVLHVGECGPFTEPGNGAVVRLVYLELLGRCPDAAGYEFWKDRLDAGSSTRRQFATQISSSQEARGQIVIDAYEMMLERSPSATDRDYWATWLGKKGRYDVLIAELAASAEFRTLAGGDVEGFVERLYVRVLQRSPSPTDADFWIDQVEAKGYRTVARILFNQVEPLGVIVAAGYQDLLGRAPTPAERTAGVALLKASSNRSALYATIIDLDEFVTRAQTLPNRD